MRFIVDTTPRAHVPTAAVQVPPVEAPPELPQYPHCDQNVLHPRGACRYCDEPKFECLHAYREARGINHTGEGDPMKYPCPAEIARPLDVIHRWGGNRPGADPINRMMRAASLANEALGGPVHTDVHDFVVKVIETLVQRLSQAKHDVDDLAKTENARVAAEARAADLALWLATETARRERVEERLAKAQGLLVGLEKAIGENIGGIVGSPTTTRVVVSR